MTGKLVLENLKHRPMRSLLSILLIGVPVTLILCLVGLSHGFIEDSQKRARGIGAETARRILIHAFAGEIIERIRHAPAREELDKLVWERLEQNPRVGEKKSV